MSAELPNCPVCENPYLAIRTDVYKDMREFIYCDCCGAMATRPLWIAASLPSKRPEAEDGWQPIETAPVGTEMFVVKAFNVTGRFTAPYTSDPWCVWQAFPGMFARWPHPFSPTHWLALPALAASQGAKE